MTNLMHCNGECVGCVHNVHDTSTVESQPMRGGQKQLAGMDTAKSMIGTVYQSQCRHQLNHILPYQILWERCCVCVCVCVSVRAYVCVLTSPPRTLEMFDCHALCSRMIVIHKHHSYRKDVIKPHLQTPSIVTVISECLCGEHLSQGDKVDMMELSPALQLFQHCSSTAQSEPCVGCCLI